MQEIRKTAKIGLFFVLGIAGGYFGASAIDAFIDGFSDGFNGRENRVEMKAGE